MNHRELKQNALANPEVREVYDQMGPEYALLRQMLKARNQAGLSQAQVAQRMGTKAPAITRLESALSSGAHSPSLATLQRYAEALGCELNVKFVKSKNMQT